MSSFHTPDTLRRLIDTGVHTTVVYPYVLETNVGCSGTQVEAHLLSAHPVSLTDVRQARERVDATVFAQCDSRGRAHAAESAVGKPPIFNSSWQGTRGAFEEAYAQWKTLSDRWLQNNPAPEEHQFRKDLWAAEGYQLVELSAVACTNQRYRLKEPFPSGCVALCDEVYQSCSCGCGGADNFTKTYLESAYGWASADQPHDRSHDDECEGESCRIDDGYDHAAAASKAREIYQKGLRLLEPQPHTLIYAGDKKWLVPGVVDQVQAQALLRQFVELWETETVELKNKIDELTKQAILSYTPQDLLDMDYATYQAAMEEKKAKGSFKWKLQALQNQGPSEVLDTACSTWRGSVLIEGFIQRDEYGFRLDEDHPSVAQMFLTK